MTSKAALCKALLDGRVLNIKNGFQLLGITNIPREIGRSVERAFGVKVSRTQKEGTSRYGQHCTWTNYRLNKTDYNKEGIQKMKEYVEEQLKGVSPKTDKEVKALEEVGITPDENLQEWFTNYITPEDRPATHPKVIQQNLFQ